MLAIAASSANTAARCTQCLHLLERLRATSFSGLSLRSSSLIGLGASSAKSSKLVKIVRDGQGRAHQKPARAFSDEGVSNEKSRRTLFCDPVAADLGNGSHGRSGAFSAARSGVRKGRSRGALGP